MSLNFEENYFQCRIVYSTKLLWGQNKDDSSHAGNKLISYVYFLRKVVENVLYKMRELKRKRFGIQGIKGPTERQG